MTTDEALDLALEALEVANSLIDGYYLPKEKAWLPEIEEAITAIKQARSAPVQEPVNRYCCHACFKASGGVMLDRMILCSECGNKRCPKASDHRLDCTSSNDPGQPGSIYTTQPAAQRQWVGLTDEEIEDIVDECDGVGWDVAQAIKAKLKEKNGV
jgi:hypothetical protein